MRPNAVNVEGEQILADFGVGGIYRLAKAAMSMLQVPSSVLLIEFTLKTVCETTV